MRGLYATYEYPGNRYDTPEGDQSEKFSVSVDFPVLLSQKFELTWMFAARMQARIGLTVTSGTRFEGKYLSNNLAVAYSF